MLVLTIQKKDNLREIYEGNYQPLLWESPYAFLSTRFSKSYTKLNKMLCDKTGKGYIPEFTPIWSWVKSPFLEFFSDPFEYVGIFMEIDRKKAVFSDYDLYTEYCQEESENSDFILSEGNLGTAKCIQCVTDKISPSSIRLVVPLEQLKGTKYESVSDLFVYELLRIQYIYLVSELDKIRTKRGCI